MKYKQIHTCDLCRDECKEIHLMDKRGLSKRFPVYLKICEPCFAYIHKCIEEKRPAFESD